MTSPSCMVGTYPSTRCRSEPQIAVEVIRTIASRLFRILGSGTSRTLTLLRPAQVFALIAASPSACARGPHCARCTRSPVRSLRELGVRQRLRRTLRELLARPLAPRGAVRADHLAGLQHLLEPAQVVVELLVRLLPE